MQPESHQPNHAKPPKPYWERYKRMWLLVLHLFTHSFPISKCFPISKFVPNECQNWYSQLHVLIKHLQITWVNPWSMGNVMSSVVWCTFCRYTSTCLISLDEGKGEYLGVYLDAITTRPISYKVRERPKIAWIHRANIFQVTKNWLWARII